ncbi:MAG: N-methyl-D-aspartate receptor NMDAR2C subunit [Candidatus Electrothrix sp. GM3_4]|nr:N-methyl-D-aspartate receptor NMDAR2C subunit [Candidatus Electrothrix sp. GM3_4]
MFHQDNLTHSLAQIGAQSSFSIFEELKAVYTEPGRYYHTDKHVGECLTHLQLLRHQATRPAEIEVALWFHDAVYDTRRPDNEERSAEWAVKFLGASKVGQAIRELVARLIMVTQTHALYDADTALMTDIDLSILGAQPHVFEQYDTDIRREYSWIPGEQFRRGRIQVLNNFLERAEIYKTSYFLAKYEQQARLNLRRKIEQLPFGLLL